MIEMARDALRALLGALARNVPAAELLPLLDAEREFLSSIIKDQETGNDESRG